ncbi:uncharacterized protein BO88DRAFT_465718 [Aspergillus vadensis CBS 113365]|uniref:Uncharacterized protein n=1 Tax=Aspergillus vadensis (strain CBS 113365 / IMI 142717 / IBT 24658) TaxID=1448311 RepID=A0A319BVQ5_ASPVC|nr:hypothetical protein BO88DRAFT_465718 [Aspergillus vadensis CBS 113365]PYH67218.1 hypothetical protein BO88DRAFT_465718 [Aspergillus vadensis CBS 113365]
MSSNFVNATGIECFIQQRYPGTSRDEAYVRLFDDLKPLINPAAVGWHNFIQALAILLNKPVYSLAKSAGRTAQRILGAVSQSPSETSQPVKDNPNDISDQTMIQILRILAEAAGDLPEVVSSTGSDGSEEYEIQHSSHGGGPRVFRVFNNSFNAGREFTAVFATCALSTTALTIQTKAKELRAIGLNPKDIPDETSYQMTPMVQGWKLHGFGYFIYKFVDHETVATDGEKSAGRHAFYVFNPTTSANEEFRTQVQKRPLLASFGGMCSDLEAVFLLMWQNRQSLRKTDPENADNVIFHLLVPAKRTFAIAERMAIDGGVGKLIIKGHTDEGACYAWFNFVSLPRQVVLHDVGNLNRDSADLDRSWKGEKSGALAFFGCGLMTIITGYFIPPAAPYFAWLCFASLAVALKYGVLDNLRRSYRSPPRILGPPSEVRRE